MTKHVFGGRSGSGKYLEVNWGEGEAEVFGSPLIIHSKIFGGKVFGNPILFDVNLINDAIIEGTPEIHYSLIMGQAIVCDRAKVMNAIITDRARVTEDARVMLAELHDDAMVCGTGEVRGTEEHPVILKGYDFIDRGVWDRAPLTFACEKSGFVINENIDNLITVSCTTNTPEKWLDRGAGRRYGRLVGLNEEQIDEIEGYVETVRDWKRGIKEYEKE